ncbi:MULTISPECIES: RodZ domain-containing protein [unclassified Moraxella]|uniref:RodZ domain-containing protein n=1 Tax=unclassified Moraxella TaxID=2685852 RepID=UPI003AF4E4B8
METSNKDLNPTPQPTIDTNQSLGQLFKTTRQQKGLSVDDVVAQTFILKRHIEALEDNNYEALPQPTFTKGFASTYGRFLGLDNQQINQLFDAQYPNHLKQKHDVINASPLQQPMGTLSRETRSGIKINPFIIIGIVLALGLAIFIFNTVTKAHTDNQTPPPATGVQDISPQEQVTGASLNNAGSAITTPATNASIASGLPQTGTAVTGVSSSPTSANLASVAVVSNSTIELWVKDDTTISITDATGKALLQGKQARGGYSLSGSAPFNVSIDNVSNVSLDLNKQPIKLSQYAQNNQASFSLNP